MTNNEFSVIVSVIIVAAIPPINLKLCSGPSYGSFCFNKNVSQYVLTETVFLRPDNMFSRSSLYTLICSLKAVACK